MVRRPSPGGEGGGGIEHAPRVNPRPAGLARLHGLDEEARNLQERPEPRYCVRLRRRPDDDGETRVTLQTLADRAQPSEIPMLDGQPVKFEHHEPRSTRCPPL